MNTAEKLDRKMEIGEELVKLKLRREEIEAEESMLKTELMRDGFMAPGDKFGVTTTDGDFVIRFVHQTTVKITDVEKVFDKLPTRKAFFEVVNVSVEKLRNKLGEDAIRKLGMPTEKEFIRVDKA